jgi:hypothetical protein
MLADVKTAGAEVRQALDVFERLLQATTAAPALTSARMIVGLNRLADQVERLTDQFGAAATLRSAEPADKAK